MTTTYSATALATTDTAKLHKLTIVMINALLGTAEVLSARTWQALERRGLATWQQGTGGACTSEGIQVVKQMTTEYDLASDQEEPAAAEAGQDGSIFNPADPDTWAEENLPKGYAWEHVGEGEWRLFSPDGTDLTAAYYDARDRERAARAAQDQAEDDVTALVWRMLRERKTVEGSKITPGMVVGLIHSDVTVTKVRQTPGVTYAWGTTPEGRPAEFSVRSDHRLTLIDSPEQLTLVDLA